MPLTRYEQVCVAHAPGMPKTFSPPLRVSDSDMHHSTCVTHMPWCIPGSLSSFFLWSLWWGKRSPHLLRKRNPQLYVSCKRPILVITIFRFFVCVRLHLISSSPSGRFSRIMILCIQPGICRDSFMPCRAVYGPLRSLPRYSVKNCYFIFCTRWIADILICFSLKKLTTTFFLS